MRIEAANAVGQLAEGPRASPTRKTRLLARARVEQDPRVWGAVAATLGRLAYTTAADVDEVEAAHRARAARPRRRRRFRSTRCSARPKGSRRWRGKAARSPSSRRPRSTACAPPRCLEGRAQDADKLTRIRRLATLALTAAGGVTRPQLEAGIRDADEEVRRLTMIAARAEIDGREAVIAKGLADANPRVRYEALQTWGRLFQKTSCEPLLNAVRDSNPHVALLAIDLLGNGCPGTAARRRRRCSAGGGAHDRRREPGIVPRTRWCRSRRSRRPRRGQLLPRYVAHVTWQVRMYAARAAGALGAVDELERWRAMRTTTCAKRRLASSSPSSGPRRFRWRSRP